MFQCENIPCVILIRNYIRGVAYFSYPTSEDIQYVFPTLYSLKWQASFICMIKRKSHGDLKTECYFLVVETICFTRPLRSQNIVNTVECCFRHHIIKFLIPRHRVVISSRYWGPIPGAFLTCHRIATLHYVCLDSSIVLAERCSCMAVASTWNLWLFESAWSTFT